jgi:hypothetical protein
MGTNLSSKTQYFLKELTESGFLEPETVIMVHYINARMGYVIPQTRFYLF